MFLKTFCRRLMYYIQHTVFLFPKIKYRSAMTKAAHDDKRKKNDIPSSINHRPLVLGRNQRQDQLQHIFQRQPITPSTFRTTTLLLQTSIAHEHIHMTAIRPFPTPLQLLLLRPSHEALLRVPLSSGIGGDSDCFLLEWSTMATLDRLMPAVAVSVSEYRTTILGGLEMRCQLGGRDEEIRRLVGRGIRTILGGREARR